MRDFEIWMILVLVLVVSGLWFYPEVTKELLVNVVSGLEDLVGAVVGVLN